MAWQGGIIDHMGATTHQCRPHSVAVSPRCPGVAHTCGIRIRTAVLSAKIGVPTAWALQNNTRPIDYKSIELIEYKRQVTHARLYGN